MTTKSPAPPDSRQAPSPLGVLITGASQGLGRALLMEAARRGHRVAGVARGRAALEEATAAALAVHPHRDSPKADLGALIEAITEDIGQRGAAGRIAARAAARLGPLDVVVHNASTLGPVPLVPLGDLTPLELAAVYDVNLFGPFALTRAVLGQMLVRGRGVICFTSSDAAVEGYPGWGAYGSSKAAADQLARVLAAEVEGTGVQVLSVDPGEMATAMHADALPDADPSTLQRPVDVAARLAPLLFGEVEPPGVRFALAALTSRSPLHPDELLQEVTS